MVGIDANSNICETKLKLNMATALGIWYIQIPYNFIVNPQGEVVDPKEHNGSIFVWHERKRKPVSKIPKFNYKEAMEFKEIFVG